VYQECQKYTHLAPNFLEQVFVALLKHGVREFARIGLLRRLVEAVKIELANEGRKVAVLEVSVRAGHHITHETMTRIKI